MAKRKKLNPNRFKQSDDKGLFSFDPLRRQVFIWGLVAGASGGVCMLRPEFFWQIVGLFLVVIISNYHINKASRQIPRLHATVWSFAGVLLAMFGVIITGTIIIAFLQAGGNS